MWFRLQEKLKKDGHPMVACKPCVETAKKLHEFAAKSAKLNNVTFPKTQEWWKGLKN